MTASVAHVARGEMAERALGGTECVGVSQRSHHVKSIIGCVVVALALAAAPPAEAKGCLKGALVGGVAGHYAGHHGTLGAIAGCMYGRHRANKQARMQQQ